MSENDKYFVSLQLDEKATRNILKPFMVTESGKQITIEDIRRILMGKKIEVEREITYLRAIENLTALQSHEDFWLDGSLQTINWMLKLIDKNEENEGE